MSVITVRIDAGTLRGSRGLFAPRMGIRSHDRQRLADTPRHP